MGSPTTSNDGSELYIYDGPRAQRESQELPGRASHAASLAGAYPQGNTVNLITALKTLQTYGDWVWSHPNPCLVANYDLPWA